MAQDFGSSKFRPPSLSLVTVTSLFEEKDRLFFGTNGRKKIKKNGVQNSANLANFYANEVLETIEEMSSIATPTIIIDRGSDPDINQTNVMNQTSGIINDINPSEVIRIRSHQQNNSETSLVKYLTPPPMRSRRMLPENGSITSTTSSSGKKMLPTNSSPSLKHKQTKEDDNISIGGCSIGRSTDFSLDTHLDGNMNIRLVKFVSVMYALFIIICGAIICVKDLNNEVNDYNHLFIIITTIMGFIWIAFLHWDIQKYKRWAVQFLKPERAPTVKDNSDNKSLNSDFDSVSISTAIIFNTYKKPVVDDSNASTASPFESAYRFLHGKHSGNFYLKCGMTVFCFGSIVHQGVNLVQQIHYYGSGVKKCQNLITLSVHSIRCLFSFYQLFMAFKYSNILINRYRTIARFALMHLVGTSISFWFSTIIEEAIEDYVNKVESMNGTHNHSVIADEALFKESISHHMYCSERSIVNKQSMDALPYLYPFTIEYNIILASVWYIIWTNIGKDDINAYSHHVRQEISENAYGEEDVQYHSAISINADCHASNRGLFGGLSTLLITFITIVIFFTTIKQETYYEVGIGIYSAQIGVLTIMCFAVIPLAYRQMKTLDVVGHHHLDNSSTAMDDLLVLIPIPFYFIHYILSIVAAANVISANNIFLIIIYILSIAQVLIQSPFIVDGIRRCSNSKKLRFKKPGRELITFTLILNITLWILNTFELKSVDKYHGMQEYYGKLNWMILSHTTLPLMLFYRFHCSVCLSDIWKYAYEKDDSNMTNM